jgi:CHAT domain-containing protein/tetratricopeptide (TPR) repeat protein
MATRPAVLWLTLLASTAAAAQPVPLEEDGPALEKRVQALLRKAVALQAQGRPAEAVPLAEKAVGLCRQLYSPKHFPAGHPALATSLSNLGVLLQGGGQPGRAESFLRDALAMRQRLYPRERFPDGHSDLAGSLSNLGWLLHARGELAGAERFLRDALAMYQTLYPRDRYPAGHPDLATSLNNLGMVLRQCGKLADAEPLLRQALAMRRQLYSTERFPAGHPLLASSLNNLGLLLQDRGELARAEPCYREALAMRQRLYPKERYPDGHPDLASNLNNLGMLLHNRGQLAEAETLYRQALVMYQKLYPKAHYLEGHPDLALSLANLGAVFQARGQLDLAEPFRRDALAMFQRLYPPERSPAGHPDLASSLNNLGLLLHERGELDRAEPLYRAAVAMCRKLYPPEQLPDGHLELIASLDNLGALLRDRGEPARAESLLREALAVQGRLREALLLGTAEAEALNHLAQLPPTRDVYLSVCRDLPDSAPQAHAALWHSRSVLARFLSQRRLAVLAAANPASRDLARRLAEKRQALAALLLARGTWSTAQAERARTLSDEKEQLEKDLARSVPAFDRLLRSGHSTPEDLRRRLPAGVVCLDLLRYVHIEHDPRQPGQKGVRRTPSYVAFVLCRDRQTRRVELGPAEPIEHAVRAWRAALMGPLRRAKSETRNLKSEQPEQVLRRLVWEPLARHLPPAAHTIYVVPDGALTQLPWAALPGSKPGTVLLEEMTVAVVPHGHFLLAALGPASEERKRPEDGTLLAVGGVAYDQAPAAASGAEGLPRAAGPAAAVRWHALPGTSRELEGIIALAGQRRVKTYRGTEASTSRLLRDLPKARWAHLATHGFFADQRLRSILQLSEQDYTRASRGERVGVGARSPLVLSGLVLAGANLQGEEAPADGGILTAEAIAGLDLDHLDLAVLSACETGLGEVAGGEGVFGLQRAFHIAGCRNVIASLWQVDDEATAALMGLFYHKLWVEKLPAAETLRQAQLGLYHHPERIGLLARLRGPDFDKAARLPATPHAADRAPARLWAGFVLSGLGR